VADVRLVFAGELHVGSSELSGSHEEKPNPDAGGAKLVRPQVRRFAAACGGGGETDGTPGGGGGDGWGGDSTVPAAAAQAFFDRERGSILRRHVRRHGLE
jgi:hypothetical protein